MKLILVLTVVVTGSVVLASHLDEECPVDCECHIDQVRGLTADCSEGNLTSVPIGFSQRTATLILDDNLLTDLDEEMPAGLRWLSLARNGITNLTTETFQNLTELESVDLSGNGITSVPTELFTNSTELTRLAIQNNPLEVIDGPFLIAENLTTLDLRNCGLSLISDDFFIRLTSLESLDLSGNPLGMLSERAMSPLTNLIHLKLNKCNLSLIQDSTFLRLGSLKSLELTLNDLGPKVNWAVLLDGVPLLERLDLSDSGITHLPENVFSTNTILRSLDLSKNKLSDLVVSTTLGHNLRHLTFLNLTDCQLTGPLSQDAFANATNLQTLILSDNFLRAGDLSEALTPLSNLTTLSLMNCSLRDIPENTFESLEVLENLDISHNPLGETSTSFLYPLSTLLRLDISHSNLQHINDSTFSNMTSLKELILSGNPLKIIDPGLFRNLTNLRVLSLDHCGLKSLNSTVFKDGIIYPELEELKLAGNFLDVPEKGPFLPKQLSSLHKLDLSHCNISHVSRDNLNKFSKLTWLSLAGNRLTDNSLEILQDLTHLKEADFSNNNLKVITPNMLKHNKHLESIKLSSNPWRCGCYVREMWLWAKANNVSLGGRAVTCQFHWAGPPGRRPSSGTLSWGRFARDPEACGSSRPRRSILPPFCLSAHGSLVSCLQIDNSPISYFILPSLVAVFLISSLILLHFVVRRSG